MFGSPVLTTHQSFIMRNSKMKYLIIFLLSASLSLMTNLANASEAYLSQSDKSYRVEAGWGFAFAPVGVKIYPNDGSFNLGLGLLGVSAGYDFAATEHFVFSAGAMYILEEAGGPYLGLTYHFNGYGNSGLYVGFQSALILDDADDADSLDSDDVGTMLNIGYTF